MATRRRGRRRRDDESRRIFQLPKDILQHILSLLPQKEAIRTCVLSKSWRHVGYTRPNVHLHESRDGCDNEFFVSALEKTLQTYHDQKLSIQDLHVEISSFDSKSSSILGKLVKNMNVVTFRLAHTWGFSMPQLIFQAESLKEMYLTRLMLTNLIDEKILFKHLKTLHLTECYTDDDFFANIISSCPLIEYLVLCSCVGLNTVELNKAHNLKRFDFTSYNGDELQDISFLNNHLPHLKSLFIGHAILSAELFSSNNYFPCLEELELDSCYVWEKEFVLSSRSIKRLIIRNMSCKCAIDAANILYFKVSNSCVLPPSISLTTTSKEWKSHVDVYNVSSHASYVSRCLHMTNELLNALNQSQISYKPSYHYFFDGNSMDEPAVVEHLDLSGCQNHSFPSEVHHILICSFRICRPRYIIGMCSGVTVETKLQSSGERKSCKRKVIIKNRVGKSDPWCFWQQDLEELSGQVWDGKAKEWHHVRLGTLRSSTLRALSDKKQIRYRLKWRGDQGMSPN